jgi:hypothetical protein
MSNQQRFADIGGDPTSSGLKAAERRFAILKQLLFRKPRHGSKGRLVSRIASRHKIGPRTLLEWERRWLRGGILALATKPRSDRRLPEGARRFINKVLPGVGAVAQWWRAYVSLLTPPAEGLSVAEMEAIIRRGHMLPEERVQRPTPSYETFRKWVRQVSLQPKLRRGSQREGQGYKQTR